MKMAMCLTVFAAIVGTCYRTTPLTKKAASPSLVVETSSEEVREYQLGNEQFAVVIVQKEEISEAEIRKMARQKAAELTVEQGYRYFTIEKEEKVRAIESEKSDFDNQQNPPLDLYEEFIQRKDLRRNGVVDFTPDGARAYPGYRITIQLYQTKPPGKSIDACKLTNCGE